MDVYEDPACTSEPSTTQRLANLREEAEHDEQKLLQHEKMMAEYYAELHREDDIYKTILAQISAGLVVGAGFEGASMTALCKLGSIIESFTKLLAKNIRAAAENAQRTRPTCLDASVAFASVGISDADIYGYISDTVPYATKIETPHTELAQPPPPMLKVGNNRPLPPCFHEDLPPLPEPHTYIHTEVNNDVEITYDKVREKLADENQQGVRSIIEAMLIQFDSVCFYGESYKKRAPHVAQAGARRSDAKHLLSEDARKNADPVDTSKLPYYMFVIKPLPCARPYLERIDDPKAEKLEPYDNNALENSYIKPPLMPDNDDEERDENDNETVMDVD